MSQVINVSALEELAQYNIKRVFLAIGVFDGVHLGHQKLLSELVAAAAAVEAVPVVMTFYPHPRQILHPGQHPVLLLPPERKIDLLHEYGAKAVTTLHFDATLAGLEPEEFLHQCLGCDQVELAGICVGSNWRFGAMGKGDSALLEQYAADGHFAFQAVSELKLAQDIIVSSTAIRRAISFGLLDDAAAMLGRHYRLCGNIISGHGVAGRELAHPTANLKVDFGVLPPAGVYAARAFIGGKEFMAAVDIGISPTYDRPEDRSGRIEAHLLNFCASIRGQHLEIEPVKWLREERCFASPAQLRAQISADVMQVKEIFT
jgi:riboflavin kinase / FMN adenylyltransferase